MPLHFAIWLRETRNEVGWSQDRLAGAMRKLHKDAKVNQTRVSEWELGKNLPSLFQFRLLSKAMGLSVGVDAAGHAIWEQVQLEDLDQPKQAAQ